MVVRRTAEDVAAWDRFIGQVCASVSNPRRATVDLERAAHKAAKAVFPCEPFTQDNPYNRLLAVTRRFATMTTVERVDAVGDLEAALDAAHAHHPLSVDRNAGPKARPEPEPDPPGRPPRADIFG